MKKKLFTLSLLLFIVIQGFSQIHPLRVKMKPEKQQEHHSCGTAHDLPNTEQINNEISEYDFYMYDRFGIRYPIERLKKDDKRGNSSNSNKSSSSSGYFDLVFDADMDADANAKIVICKVFEDLSSLIVRPSNTTCGGNVVIEINSYNGPSNVLGVGSSYYNYASVPNNNGLLYGEVWKAVNSGIGNNSFFGGQTYHGYVNININTNINWNKDLNTLTLPTGTNDLYDVVMHEALHTLGFASMIQSDGSSPFDMYTKYDLALSENGNNLIYDSGNHFYQYNSSSSLTATCHTLFDNTPTQIFAPNTFMNQSSLSHMEDCNSIEYTMDYTLSSVTTAIRGLHTEEKDILCHLGYTLVSNSVSYCSSNPIIALNDGLDNSCSNPITGDMCTPIIINPLANDINVIDFFDVVVLQGNGTPTITNTNTTISYQANQTGLHILKYIPKNGADIGNFGLIFISVHGCPGLNCTPVVGACNLICNPDIEDFDSDCDNSFTGSQGIGGNSASNLCDNNSSTGAFSGWEQITGTPDFINSSTAGTGHLPTLLNNNSGNTNVGGFFGITSLANFSESFGASINIVTGKKYIVSFYRNETEGPTQAMNNVNSIIIGAANANDINISFDPLDPNHIIQNITIGGSTFTSNWDREIFTFTPSVDYERLYFAVDGSSHGAHAFFDNIELIEDNFDDIITNGDRVSPTCGDVVQIGDNLCGIEGTEYKWFLLDDDGNEIGGSISGSLSTPIFTVSPIVTTSYRLKRYLPGSSSPSASGNITVTVMNAPDADFASITQGNGTYDFTSNDQNPLFAHDWNFGDPSIPNSALINPTSISFPPYGAYTVTHTVNHLGCVTTASEVIVYDNPGGNGLDACFDINQDGCGFYDFTSHNQDPNNTHHWDFGDPSIPVQYVMNPNNVDFNNVGSGVYTITHTISDGTNTDVYVQTLTVIAGIADASFSSQQVDCQTYNFNANSQDGLHTWTFTHQNGSAFSLSSYNNNSNISPQNISFQLDGLYTVTHQVNNGCGTSVMTESIIVSDIDETFNYDEIDCGTFSFTSLYTGGTHEWTFENAVPATSTDPNPASVVFNQEGTWLVTHRVTVGNCIEEIKLYVSVVIPKAEFSYQGADCQFIFIPVHTGGTHYWDLGNGQTSTDISPEITFTASGVYTIIHEVTEGNCTKVYQEDITITFPDPDFIPEDLDCGLYQFNPLANSSYITPHLWTITDPNGNSVTYTDEYPIHQFSMNGIHTITHELTSNCGTHSSTQTINVTDVLDAEFTYSDFCLKVDFFANNPSLQHTWDFGDGNFSNTANPVHTYLLTGTYTVIHTVTQGNCEIIYEEEITIESLFPVIIGSEEEMEYGIDVEVDQNNNSYVLGYNQGSTWLYKIDDCGDIIWSKDLDWKIESPTNNRLRLMNNRVYVLLHESDIARVYRYEQSNGNSINYNYGLPYVQAPNGINTGGGVIGSDFDVDANENVYLAVHDVNIKDFGYVYRFNTNPNTPTNYEWSNTFSASDAITSLTLGLDQSENELYISGAISPNQSLEIEQYDNAGNFINAIGTNMIANSFIVKVFSIDGSYNMGVTHVNHEVIQLEVDKNTDEITLSYPYLLEQFDNSLNPMNSLSLSYIPTDIFYDETNNGLLVIGMDNPNEMKAEFIESDLGGVIWSEINNLGSGMSRAEGIATNGNDKVLTTGSISEPSIVFGNSTANYFGEDDIFVARLVNTTANPFFGKQQQVNTPLSIKKEVRRVDSENFIIAPNPTNGQFTLTLSEKSTQAIIDIFDLQGRKVQSINQGEQEQIQIDLSNETAGLYFVRINIGEQIITKRVLLIK